MIVLTLVLLSMTEGQAAYDLEQSFAAAVNYSSQVKSSGETLKASGERLKAAYRSFGPTIALKGSYVRRDADPSAFGQGLAKQKDAWIGVSQPIFQGTKEYAGLRQTKAQEKANSFWLKNNLRTLYDTLVSVYFQVLIQEKDIQNLNEQLDLAKSREAELKKRTSIGRSRESELLLSKAQVLNTQVAIEAAKESLNNYRSQWSYLTGLAPTTALLPPQENLPPLLSLGIYLKALEDHPEIKAREFEVKASDENVAMAKASHYPTIDVRGNYYLHREGGQKNIKWDTSVNLTMPLFESGVTSARVSEEAFKRNSVIESKRQGEIELEEELTQIVQAIESGKKRLSDLKEAAGLGKRHYQLQQKEYRLGLVTNLDVIQSLNSYIETQRSMDKLKLEIHRDFKRLEGLTKKELLATVIKDDEQGGKL